MRRLRVVLKWVIQLGILLAMLLGVVLFFALIFYGWLGTASGNRFIAARLENTLEIAAKKGTVTIGSIETNARSYVIIHDLTIATDEGKTVVFAGRGQAEISPFSLLYRDLQVNDLQLDSVLVDIEMGEDRVTDIGRVFGQEEVGPAREEPWGGLPIDIAAPDVRLNGVNIVYRNPNGEVVRATGVSATGRIESKDDVFDFLDIELEGQLAGPGPSVVSANGSLTYSNKGLDFDHVTARIPGSEVEAVGTIGGGEIDLDLDVRALHLPALEPIINNPGLAGTYAGELELRGPTSAAKISGELNGIKGTKGNIAADIQANLTGEKVTWTAEVDVEGLHVEQLYPALTQDVVLDGEATLNGKGIRFPDDFELTVAYRGPEQEAFGQHLDSVETTFKIENGQLEIQAGHLMGILGELEAEGDIDLVEGPMELHITGWVRPERLEELGIAGIRTSGWVDARLYGNLKDPEAIFDVRGNIRFAPFQYMEDVHFGLMSASFDVDVDGLDIQGTASVDGSEGDTYGLKLGALQIPALTLSIPPKGTLRFAGDLAAQNLVYPDALVVDAATGEWSFENTPEGTQTTHAELAIGSHAVMNIPGSSGGLTADVVNDDVSFDVELDSGYLPFLRTGGRYDLATGRIALDHLAIAPTPRATWKAPRQITFTTTEGGLADADILLEGNLGNFEVMGTLGTTGELDGRIIVTNMQMDTFAELYPDDYSGLAGTIQVDVKLNGRADAPEIKGMIDMKRLWMEDTFRWLDVDGTFSADGGNLWPNITIGVAGEPLAHIDGRVSVDLDLADPKLSPTGDIDMKIGIRAGKITRIDQLVPGLGTELPTGVFSGQIGLSGQAIDPDFRFAGTTEVDVRGWADPARVEFQLSRTADQLDGWADVRDGMEQRMNLGMVGTTRMSEIMAWSLQGGPEPDLEDYTLFLDDMFLSGTLLGFPADSIAVALGAPVEASGNVLGGFTAWGSPYTPQAEGGFHWVEATIGTVAMEGALVSMSPVEGGYQLDITSNFAPEGEVSVTGLVPVAVDLNKDWTEWATGDLDLTVSGAGVPIGLASGYDPGVERAQGLLKVEGKILGDPANPSPFLTASITDGSFNYRPLGLMVRGMDMAFESGDSVLTLTKLHMSTQPRNRRGNVASGIQDLGEFGQVSTIDVSGSAKLGERSLGEVDAKVVLGGGAWIINDEIAALRADGEIGLSGIWPNIIVDGDLELFSGKVVMDAASFLSAAPLELDRTLTIRRPDAIALQRTDDLPALYDDFDVQLRIDMNRALELDMSVPFVEDFGALGAAVSRADLSARLGGEATAQLKGGEIGMVGEVELVEGKIRVLQSRFNLEEGKMFFAGADPYNPIMDIQAQMKIPDATVDLHMSGTPEEPTIDFSSEEYPDKSQVFTILITGQAPDELTSGQGQGTAQALAGLLVSSIFSGRSLGNFSIEPDGSVRAGAPITQNIFAATILSPNASIEENKVAVEAEWGPLPHVVVSGGVGDTTTFGDLFWEIRF